MEVHAAQDVQLVLMHAGQYPLTGGGTANFVVGTKDCLNNVMRMNPSGNSGGWNGTELRAFLNGELKNAVPQTLLSAFKTMAVTTAIDAGTTVTVSEDIFSVPAEKEVFGANTVANPTSENELFQFEYFKTTGNRRKKVNGSLNEWWERSRTGDTKTFCSVKTDGTAYYTNAEYASGVSFFACI